MGRHKVDSVELDPRPADSHVAKTDQDDFGHVFRRNMPYGTVTNHGTMFVGFSADQRRLSKMLESMAGVADGVRDALLVTNASRIPRCLASASAAVAPATAAPPMYTTPSRSSSATS